MGHFKKALIDGMLDISRCKDVEITISQLCEGTPPVIHVNLKDGCVLRICRIEGRIFLNGKEYKVLDNKEPV